MQRHKNQRQLTNQRPNQSIDFDVGWYDVEIKKQGL